MDEQELKTMLESVRVDTLEALKATKEEWKKHYEELKQIGAPDEEIKKKLENALRRLDESEAMLKRPGTGNAYMDFKTIGQQVTANPELAALKGRWFNGLRVNMVFNEGLFPQDMAEHKTLVTTTAVGSSTPGILTPTRQPGIVMPGITRIRVRDLIPRIPVSTGVVEWVKENAFTNAASPQVEGSAKSESALTFTIDYIPIKTLAHWIPATKQILDDLPILQDYIESRLIDGLRDLEDTQIVSGDGVGQNLKGLTTWGTAVVTSVASDTRIDKIARMIEDMYNDKLDPSGVILNASDWMRMQTIKEDISGANTGSYILGGPRGIAQPLLWGLPLAATTGIASGTAIIGAFNTHVRLLDRMQAQIDISNEHSTYFTENKVAIRAEERIALAVTRADAVVYNTSF